MTKKVLYICGDSFCCSDPDPLYGNSWIDVISRKCPELDVINLGIAGASNYSIYLQVKHAIENNCDYLIYHATSSIRQEFVLNYNTEHVRDNIGRYWNVCAPNASAPLLCTSWPSIARNTEQTFTKDEYQTILNFFKRFVDLPVLIEKNYIFILHTLQLISSNKKLTNWAWTRGGFEHRSFDTIGEWDFSQWELNECAVNLWDHYDPKLIRPYHHVTDNSIIEKVCNTYIDMLGIKC